MLLSLSQCFDRVRDMQSSSRRVSQECIASTCSQPFRLTIRSRVLACLLGRTTRIRLQRQQRQGQATCSWEDQLTDEFFDGSRPRLTGHLSALAPSPRKGAGRPDEQRSMCGDHVELRGGVEERPQSERRGFRGRT